MKTGKILAGFLFLLGCGCNGLDQIWAVNVENNSQQNIYIFGLYELPDTLLPEKRPFLKSIAPKKIGTIYDSSVGDPKLEKMKTERLTIFIFNKDTVDKYDWNEVRLKYKILQRREILESDLKDNSSIEFY